MSSSEEAQPQKKQSGTQTLANLAFGALAYTAVGTAAAYLWNYAASYVVALPMIPLMPFVALWWLWLFFFFPNAVLILSIFLAVNNKRQ